MPGQTIAFLLLRFFSLYWFLKGFNEIGGLVITAIRYHTPGVFWNAGFSALYIIIALIVWVASHSLSRLMMRRHEGSVSLDGVSREDLYAVGLVLMGSYYFLSSVAPTVNWVHYYAMQGAAKGFQESVESGSLYDFFHSLVTLSVSFILILTGPKWARKLAATPEGSNERSKAVEQYPG